MKKPKMRIPRAKPQIKHKSLKDYSRETVVKFKCVKCKNEFYTYNYPKREHKYCMECVE